MAEPKPQPGIFYGWYIVATCFVIMAITGGSGATFPVFLVALTDEFHWSQAALGGTVAVGMIVGGLVTPFWGNWTDRSGARVVVVTAILFGGLITFLRTYIGELWHIYMLSAVGAIFFSGISLIPLSAVIAQWFHKKRGKAMGITLVGGGVGGFIGPPLANYIIESFGWRSAYMAIAVVLWIGIIPIAALVLRRRPQDFGLLPDGEIPGPKTPPDTDSMPGSGNAPEAAPLPEEEEHPPPERGGDRDRGKSLTPKEAMRTRAFWMIAVAFLFPMMSAMGLLTHLIAIFKHMGVGSGTASLCLGLIGGLSVVGRLGFGFAADRFDVRKVFTVCFSLEATSVAVLLTTPLFGAGSLYGFVLIYGLTGGGGLVLAPLIISKCFGLRSMGTIFGLLAIAAVIGGATGAVLVGKIFDTTGGYYLAFVIFSIAEVCAAIAISRARPPLERSEAFPVR